MSIKTNTGEFYSHKSTNLNFAFYSISVFYHTKRKFQPKDSAFNLN